MSIRACCSIVNVLMLTFQLASHIRSVSQRPHVQTVAICGLSLLLSEDRRPYMNICFVCFIRVSRADDAAWLLCCRNWVLWEKKLLNSLTCWLICYNGVWGHSRIVLLHAVWCIEAEQKVSFWVMTLNFTHLSRLECGGCGMPSRLFWAETLSHCFHINLKAPGLFIVILTFPKLAQATSTWHVAINRRLRTNPTLSKQQKCPITVGE